MVAEVIYLFNRMSINQYINLPNIYSPIYLHLKILLSFYAMTGIGKKICTNFSGSFCTLDFLWVYWAEFYLHAQPKKYTQKLLFFSWSGSIMLNSFEDWDIAARSSPNCAQPCAKFTLFSLAGLLTFFGGQHSQCCIVWYHQNQYTSMRNVFIWQCNLFAGIFCNTIFQPIQSILSA